jgi:hypothetical protein
MMPGEINQQRWVEWFGRVEGGVDSARNETTRAMDEIKRQLERGHVSDPAVAEGLTGLLNRSYAAIIATQDQIEDLKSGMESAGMLPPKPEKKGGRSVGSTGG